ncbi:transporter associated domain-containing protein [Paracoccus aminophilus]|uniref:Hemolysin n=1 Tax=Paracoccus aminophilus JCM 7686 TaxID=1367847 RepID=S5XZY8_PARAH|nr:hemolysin family protein [Paracoccus aminophilus]AGT09000.1 hemolysin [Paracoccus aminophilus JCM 7686]
MSSDRSPDTPVSADPATWAESEGGDGRDLPQSRGFLGRIFGAFGGADSDNDAAERPAAGGASASAVPGLLNLRRLRVDDVAIPKAEIMAVPVDIALPELVAHFREQGFTRIPVYRGTLDTPLGLIHLKDLALKYGFGAQAPAQFALRPMLRPLLYVPPSMPLAVLLQQMQQKRIHMALVIDEYGGVDGLVTIEDLIEQVVGEIDDEHDEVEGDLWIAEKPGQWLIQARAPLEDVESVTGLRLSPEEEEEDVDTLGGLIFTLTGRVPVKGEVIRLESGAEIDVVEADPRRVKRVRLRLPQPEDDLGASGE